MGLGDILSDLYASLTFSDVHAEAPHEEAEDSEQAEGEEEKSGESNGASEDGADSDVVEHEGEAEGEGGEQAEKEAEEEDVSGEEEEEEEEAEEEAEEEEEEEPVDIKPVLEEECSRSAQCAPVKHHYDECAERVTAQEADSDHKGPKEDCLEEFFHLTHCATQCAAPKLFRQLK